MKAREHIEIFGIGGAGKTTLLERLARNYSGDRLIFIRPSRPRKIQVILSALGFGFRISLLYPSILVILLNEPGGKWLFKKLAFRLACFRYNNRRGRRVLIDCGLLEPLVTHSMFYGALSQLTYYRLLMRALPTAVKAVHLRCDKGLAFNRFVSRESRLGRASQYNTQNMRQHYAQAEQLSNHIEQWCVDDAIEVIRLDQQETTKDARLIQFVKDLET